MKKLILTLVFLFLVGSSQARIIYVHDDAIDANDGSSWADAFNSLQDALAVAQSGDEIRVAQGTYKPDQGAGVVPGDREATFQLINGVTISGGYAGAGEPDPNARDIELYETILSGDLDGDDVDVNGTEDLLYEPTRGENSYNVVTGSKTDSNAILDGFIITGGNANKIEPAPCVRSSVIYKYSIIPAMNKSMLSENSVTHSCGGGMYNYGGNPVVKNCTFTENSAIGGGGMCNYESNPTVFNCTFSMNNNNGMHNGWSSTKVTNSTFRGNSATYDGGGMYNFYSNLILNKCKFIFNSADYTGGGMCNSCSMVALTHCIFSGNSTNYFGGGMYNSHSSTTMVNCTFTGNLSTEGGGISIMYNSNAMQNNCILWANTAVNGSEISVKHESILSISYSNIKDGKAGVYDPCECVIWGSGNIYVDPCFVQLGYWESKPPPEPPPPPIPPLPPPPGSPSPPPPTNNEYYTWVEGDYHLLPDSPCIDAGDPNYIGEPNETDLDGKPRVIGGRIDMGAYEYSPPISAMVMVRIMPRAINLQSKGNWITCYIWLPEQYNVADIEPNSVFLEGKIQGEPLYIDEQQQVAITKFSREEVQGIISTGEVELAITGQLKDGTIFEATDIIRVIGKIRSKN